MVKNKKAQGLSIHTLVVIALAIFVIFLVIGFVTGGFSYFAGKFGLLKPESVEDARLRCQQSCASYVSSGSPIITENDIWYNRLKADRKDTDLNDDGLIDDNDAYTCLGILNAVLTSGDCRITKCTNSSQCTGLKTCGIADGICK